SSDVCSSDLGFPYNLPVDPESDPNVRSAPRRQSSRYTVQENVPTAVRPEPGYVLPALWSAPTSAGFAHGLFHFVCQRHEWLLPAEWQPPPTRLIAGSSRPDHRL